MASKAEGAGLYVHVPFCLKKCGYCDFYSVSYEESLAGAYITAVLAEARAARRRFGDICYNTLYIGGGTPSILSSKLFSRLIEGLTSIFKIEPVEFTVEANPARADLFALYRACGANRISLGVQSLNDRVLKTAGRGHTAAEALIALERAAAVFPQVSADIMLGLPGQTNLDVTDALEKIMPYANHISAYMLKLSRGVPMAKAAEKGKIVLPNEDETVELYNACYSHLQKNAYERYEISNFARENRVSLHNMKYWTHAEYLGLGASAHSYMQNRRYENASDIESYINGKGYGLQKETAPLTAEERLFEAIMLGLRLKQGIHIPALENEYGILFQTRFAAPLKKLSHVLEQKENRLRIKDEYLLLENSILLEFME